MKIFHKIKTSAREGSSHHPNQNHLLIFGRYPIPGKTKTRLIPALGPLGAAECHRRLTERTVAIARSFVNRTLLSCPTSIGFYYDGGTTAQFQRWLDNRDGCKSAESQIDFQRQCNGDLGQRMRCAITESFKNGASKVLLVGTDLPDLAPEHFEAGFEALNTHDLVLGPSMDGGYWLVGMGNKSIKSSIALKNKRDHQNRKTADIFDHIDWGTEQVLAQTIAAAEKLNLKTYQLDLLNDLDTPDDLKGYELNMAKNQENRENPVGAKKEETGELPLISVIIPALNEASRIGSSIKSALHLNSEIIVVDGGSRDDTVLVAKEAGATKIITGVRGRAPQQNLGAQAAKGEILLFLHADTILPPDYAESLFISLLDTDNIAGAFSFKTDSSTPLMKLVSVGVNLRSRWLKMPYGDQALFFRRAVFYKSGGFPQSTIAEDLLLIRALTMGRSIKRGKLAILPACVITSARRWNSVGILRTTIINLTILSAILLGVSSESLAWLYHGVKTR